MLDRFWFGFFLSEASAEICRDCEAINYSDTEEPAVYMGSVSARSFQEFEGHLHDTRISFSGLQLAFILTTDVSKTALGAILSQVQNGEERPIAYASRQTNKAE